MTVPTTEVHLHVWQPNGIAEIDRESCSPVSHWDDYLYTEVISLAVCACGKMRSVRVGTKNGRRRINDR